MKYHKVIKDLKNSGEVTPDGQNIGDVMKVIPIDYKVVLKNLGTFEKWVNKQRKKQGIAYCDDYIYSRLQEALTDGTKLYGDKTAKEYLEYRIDQGVTEILVQVSNEAGLKSLLMKSPNSLTDNGTKPLKIAGYNVGQMGIFEWIALTLHENPGNISSEDWSWLLANRVGARVPNGDFRDGQVNSGLFQSDRQNDFVRPRLAVIDCDLELSSSSLATTATTVIDLVNKTHDKIIEQHNLNVELMELIDKLQREMERDN